MPAIWLADLARGRDNNFNLIRFLAATAVILFHSYALTDRWTDEPLWKLAPELNFGALGVKAFFFVSGFLVTKSWLARSRWPRGRARYRSPLFSPIRRHATMRGALP